jgi:hypothetical protein
VIIVTHVFCFRGVAAPKNLGLFGVTGLSQLLEDIAVKEKGTWGMLSIASSHIDGTKLHMSRDLDALGFCLEK